MAYRLKQIQYKDQSYHILLQNENGPCPLLAAANVLLLKKAINLPPKCVGSGVVTIEDLTNILAEKILSNNQNSRGNDHHIDEVMKIFPNLQFGMDVNPKFTAGPTGVEYTMELNAFDLLQIELVHGWLLESDAQEYEWVGDNTYNQLVNLVIEGNDASSKLQQKLEIDECKYDELSNQATRGTIIRNFLDRTNHQLTQHGLFVLHEYVKEGNMVVFFRNNHYNTLTKYNGNLYLLVTDFGYANVKNVIWEKLDVIDGDTEYVTGKFEVPPAMKHHVASVASGEQLVENSAQSKADYHLALQLSQETSRSPTVAAVSPSKKSNETNTKEPMSDIERATQASLLEYQQQQNSLKPPATMAPPNTPSGVQTTPTIAVGIPSAKCSQEERDMMLAMQLQRQEERREERIRQHQSNLRAEQRTNRGSKDSNCIIS